jgi:hypothetical protein
MADLHVSTTVAEPPVAARDALVERRAILTNMVIVPLCYATGRLSADLVQLYAVQALHLSPAQVGLALGSLVLSVPFQLAAVRLPRRLGFRRTMRLGYGVLVVLLVLLAAVPELARFGGTAVFVGFVAVLLCIEIAISISWGVAWHPWMRVLVTGLHRARFVARMQFATQMLNVTLIMGFGLVAGAVVDKNEYRVLLAVIIGFLLLSIAILGRMPPSEVPAEQSRRSVGGELRAAVRGLLGEPALRRLTVIYLIDTLLTAPVVAIYAVVVLRIPAAVVAAILAVRGLAAPLSLVGWGRLTRRFSTYQIITVTMMGTIVVRILWLLLPANGGPAGPGTRVLFAAIVVTAAVFTAGYGNANLITWYQAIPDSHARAMFALRDVVASSKLQLYAAAGGLVLAASAGLGTASFGVFTLDGYRLFLLAGIPVAVLIGCLSRRAQRDGAR